MHARNFGSHVALHPGSCKWHQNNVKVNFSCPMNNVHDIIHVQCQFSFCTKNSIIIPLTKIGETPSQVNSLRVTTSTATTLTINWTVSGVIDQFEVTYNYTINRCSVPRLTFSSLTVNISNGSMRSHTLRDLNEDSNYTINVTAVNAAGSTMATITAATMTAGETSDTLQLYLAYFIGMLCSSQWHSYVHQLR